MAAWFGVAGSQALWVIGVRQGGFGGVVLFLLSFVASGWLQYVLVQAMHEACHQKFHLGGWPSFAAALFTTWPLGLTRAYRKIHFAHHRFAGDPSRDPDWPLYSTFPRSRWHFIGMILFYGTGLPAVIQKLRQRGSTNTRRGARGSAQRAVVGELAMVAALQLAFLVVYSAGAWALSLSVGPVSIVAWGLVLYVAFWFAPIVTVVKTLGFLRILAEHGDPVRPIAFRSFDANALGRLILGPFGFAQHAEHHAYMAIPHNVLIEVFEKHKAQLEHDPEMSRQVIYQGTHFRKLMDWFRELPWVSGTSKSA